MYNTAIIIIIIIIIRYYSFPCFFFNFFSDGVSIGVQTHGWRHGKIDFFVLSKMTCVLKMFTRLFRIEQVKASRTV